MIRILVMAHESLFADYIASTLSQEIDLDVIRVTRDELGLRRDYSVVIVVDEEMDEREPIQLKEIMRNDSNLLLIRVSLKNRNVYIDESYQLINPGMGQVVDLVRDFSKKNLKKKSEDDTDSQKKMIKHRRVQTDIYDRQNIYFPVEHLNTTAQVTELEDRPSIRVGNRLLSREYLNAVFYFFLQQLRRKNLESVTLSNRHVNLAGNKK